VQLYFTWSAAANKTSTTEHRNRRVENWDLFKLTFKKKKNNTLLWNFPSFGCFSTSTHCLKLTAKHCCASQALPVHGSVPQPALCSTHFPICTAGITLLVWAGLLPSTMLTAHILSLSSRKAPYSLPNSKGILCFKPKTKQMRNKGRTRNHNFSWSSLNTVSQSKPSTKGCASDPLISNGL